MRTNRRGQNCCSCGEWVEPGKGELFSSYDAEDDEDRWYVRCLDSVTCAATVARQQHEDQELRDREKAREEARIAILAEMKAAGWTEVITELFGQDWRADDTADPSGYLRIIDDERQIVRRGDPTASKYDTQATELKRIANPCHPNDHTWMGWLYFMRG